MSRQSIIKDVIYNVRNYILEKYNGSIMGKCIEASDLIVAELGKNNIRAEAIKVFCLYENFESCTYYCFEEHYLKIPIISHFLLYL